MRNKDLIFILQTYQQFLGVAEERYRQAQAQCCGIEGLSPQAQARIDQDALQLRPIESWFGSLDLFHQQVNDLIDQLIQHGDH